MKRVLLIEPDRVLSETYSKYLKSMGLSVEVATNAQDAVNLADKNTPDLIIAEIQLVAHSGIEFLYEFRSYPEWQKIPVLILSIIPKQEFQDNWKLLRSELNIKKYLYKPTIDLSELGNEVLKALK